MHRVLSRSIIWDTSKPGPWTLDWTVDWSADDLYPFSVAFLNQASNLEGPGISFTLRPAAATLN